MKLTCVTAVFNAIKSGNRENLIRCVRSVAALKTEHEHLIYDGGSTDGTVELLRELEREINQKVGGESRWTADELSSSVDAFVSNASEGNGRSSADAIETIASTYGGESGALLERALPRNDNSATSHSSLLTIHSEKDTGIYNALNKGVRDAKGEWFYVLGCDDYIAFPEQMEGAMDAGRMRRASIVASPIGIREDFSELIQTARADAFSSIPYPHQGVLVRTDAIRRYDGFDERYYIAADADLIWRMVLGNEHVAFYDYPYAYYSMNGFSTGNAKLKEEMQTIVGRLHGLSRMEAERLLALRILPVRVCLRLLFQGSSLVSAAALFYLARWLANALGLIGDNGALVFRRDS